MIQHIHIENFRCFDEIDIEGFGRVNLFTGLNDTGKTALLEALFLLLDVRSFTEKLNVRGSFENDEDVMLSLVKDREAKNEMWIWSKEVKERLHLAQQILEVKHPVGNIFSSNKFVNIAVYKNSWSGDLNLISLNRISLIFDKKNQYPNPVNLAAAIDNAELRGQKQLIIDGIRTIDSSIDDLRTFASKPNVLFLQKDGKYIPIDYFGDGVQKMVRYLCTILEWGDTPNAIKYLLIDEIENGLHHTVQADFWLHLFRFAKTFDVQIFATCHSLEMLQAFSQVANSSDDYKSEAAYFEMGKHAKTKKIVAVKHDMELLKYELENHLSNRGESPQKKGVL